MEIRLTLEAEEALADLERFNSKKYRKVLKTLGLMEQNLRHQSLKTHKYNNLKGTYGETVFESYVENKTPGVFRVFWHYGSENQVITIIAIVPHP